MGITVIITILPSLGPPGLWQASNEKKCFGNRNPTEVLSVHRLTCAKGPHLGQGLSDLGF
jgi:hypothetical protein